MGRPRARAGQMSRKRVYTVEKKMQKTETAADQSIADKPHQCSFLASPAFKLSVFPAPCTYVFTAKTKSSDWLKKCIKKFKNQQTPLFSVFSVITDTSPSLLPQWEN